MRKFLDRLDSHYTKICLYAGVTVLLTFAAGMVLYFSSGFFVNLWLLICAVLEPAVYGALIAYLLNPGVVRVSHALKRAGWKSDNYKTRRVVGIVTCLLVLVLIVVGIVLIMLAVITRSIAEINIDSLQELVTGAQDETQRFADSLQSLISRFVPMSADAADAAGAAGTNPGEVIANLFEGAKNLGSTLLFSVIFAIYYLMDGDHVGGYLLRVLEAVVGRRATTHAMGLLSDADRIFSGYIRGQFTDALVVGLLSAVALTLLGVPYGPLVGLLTGLGNLIPYVGAPLGILTTVMVCVADSQLDKIVVGIVCLAIIMFVDSNVINPKLLSDNVEVHPLLVVAALIAGGAVGGLAGMLVAVPAAAFLKMQLDRWLEAREEGPGQA